MTKPTVQKLEQALMDGFSVEMACSVSGISRSTYYEHLGSNQAFSHKMTLAQQWPTQRAKQVVVQAINNGDLPSAKWWLEHRSRDEFGTNPTPPKEVYGKARIFGTDDEEKQLEFLNRSLAALADRH